VDPTGLADGIAGLLEGGTATAAPLAVRPLRAGGAGEPALTDVVSRIPID
jgi:hypothetical protein